MVVAFTRLQQLFWQLLRQILSVPNGALDNHVFLWWVLLLHSLES
jgi:hypothetical protein